MKVEPVAGQDKETDDGMSNIHIFSTLRANKRRNLPASSNLMREAETSRITLVGVVCAVFPIFLAAACLKPDMIFDDISWSKVEQGFLAVVAYRTLFESTLCILRCKYHKASAIEYMHDKKVQACAELAGYAVALLIFKYTDRLDDDVSPFMLFVGGALIESIALALTAVIEDAESCFEAPLIQMIILPISYSILTFFFISVLAIYLALTNEKIPQDSDMMCDSTNSTDATNSTISTEYLTDDTSFAFSTSFLLDFDVRFFLLISVGYPAISYAFLFFLLSSKGSSLAVGWGAHLKEEFASQSYSYAMLVRIANGFVNLPQVTGMLRVFMSGGATFYLQVIFKIAYQTISKVLVYKVDVALVKELAKRDGTFEMEGVAFILPYSVPNAVTVAVREKVEQCIENMSMDPSSTFKYDPKSRLREPMLLAKERMIEEAKIYREFRAKEGSEKEAKARKLIDICNEELIGMRPFNINEESCDVEFSLEKDSNIVSMRATVDLPDVKAFEVFDLLQQIDVLSGKGTGVKYRNTINVIAKPDKTTQTMVQHIPMPSPLTDREIVYTQTSIRLKNGTFVVAFEDAMDIRKHSSNLLQKTGSELTLSPGQGTVDREISSTQSTPSQMSPIGSPESTPLNTSPHTSPYISPLQNKKPLVVATSSSSEVKRPTSPLQLKRSNSPTQIKRSISPFRMNRASPTVSPKLSARESGVQRRKSMKLLVKSKFRQASFDGAAGYIIHPTGSGCRVTQLVKIDFRGTYMPRTVFRFILPAMQGVSAIHDHFQDKALVPGGMISFLDRPNSEPLIGSMKSVCSLMLSEATSTVEILQKRIGGGGSDLVEDDAIVDDEYEEKESKTTNDEGTHGDETGNGNLSGSNNKEAAYHVISSMLNPAVQLDVPPDFIERSASTSLRGGLKSRGAGASFTSRSAYAKIKVSPDFNHLAKGNYSVTFDQSMLICKLDFECSAAELTSRIAYRTGFGMQFKRKMEEVYDDGTTKWRDEQIIFGADASEMSKVEVEYKQTVSSLPGGSFVVQRISNGDRPSFIKKDANKDTSKERSIKHVMSNVLSLTKSRTKRERRSSAREADTPIDEEAPVDERNPTITKQSSGVLSWRKRKDKKEKAKVAMDVGTQQTLLLVADVNKKKRCSLVLHGTFFPMEREEKEYNKVALRSLVLDGMFNELHELQQHYLSEAISATTKNVIRARNNIGKGSWKLGFDEYNSHDNEVFKDGFTRYNQVREDFNAEAWHEVETKMMVHNIKTWWQKKRRRKRLTDHVMEAADLVGMGISQALGSLRGSLNSFRLDSTRNSRPSSGRSTRGGRSPRGAGIWGNGSSSPISTSGVAALRTKEFGSPADRLEHLKATKEKERSSAESSVSSGGYRGKGSDREEKSKNNSAWVVNARRKSQLVVKVDWNLPSMRIAKDVDQEADEVRRADRASKDVGKRSLGKSAAMNKRVQGFTDKLREKMRHKKHGSTRRGFGLSIGKKGFRGLGSFRSGARNSTGGDDEEWIGSEHSFSDGQGGHFVHMGYVECLIHCKPSLVKNFVSFVFDKNYEGPVLSEMGITVLSHLTDHSCVVHFKHHAVWPMTSRDFVCIVSAKEGVLDEKEEAKQDEATRPSFVQNAKRRMSGIIFDAAKVKSRRPSKKRGKTVVEGKVEVKAKESKKDVEVLVINISSVDESECERFGVKEDINFVRGSMQCDLLVRGVKLETKASTIGNRERSKSKRSRSSQQLDPSKRAMLARIGSATVKSRDKSLFEYEGNVERLNEALKANSMQNLKQNTAKTEVLIKNSEKKLRKDSIKSLRTGGDRSIGRSGDRVGGKNSRGEPKPNTFDDEAKTTLVSFLGSVDAKGQLSRIYVDGEAKKLAMTFKKIKDDLELTTLTAMGRTYKERIGEMNTRLAFKWNQENLMEKSCNILAVIVYLFEEFMIYDVNVLRGDGCLRLFGKLATGVLLVLTSEFLADYFLAKYAMRYCDVNMTQRFGNENKANLVFCLFFIVTTYIAATAIAYLDKA
eukprot:CAMPEP_0118633604 /NCGR_PEP_ID=MMETSP0785-20121206/1090_1 /TAXON_ID=91992 /ORGANISM="Bolidomonas pacifica, Strain CCMP 1866" /LENGTH=1999 /DNA_ID=CAMNT_0006524499 /DNA_START=6 /DNA_END=6008 /DNA_ORIENTATION=+